MKIGFFDSGLGGLTILKKVMKHIPTEYIYLADNKNAPYGLKSVKTVQILTLQNVEILISYGCKIIVIACNTATSACINLLRKTYPNILFIGTEPAISLAVKANPPEKRILVTATSLTLYEAKLQNLISKLNSNNIIDLLPLGELVNFADELDTIQYDAAYNYLQTILSKYNLNLYSGIVLGCTHFPIFINEFKKILPNTVTIYDSSDGILDRLKEILKLAKLDFDDQTIFKLLLSDETESFRMKALNFIST